ncbi:hypothetical protein JNB_08374 [Janibacter sp. HTCC2649]|uniref:hypothetical protein n=1 Tax=Janibacter sp. HTCC2649 TaxID=313589 RepID=UPI0000670B90|nr:hypothetical protein [Janibacter sp. HTCC2649]EAQ00172.1 hypothetical protein JNB_08374 [Janibacter sp. HTCC2649]
MKISMRRSSGAALALTGLLALGACGSSEGTADSSASQAKGDTVDAGDLAGRMVAAMEKAGSGTMTMDTGGEKASGDFKYVDGKLQQHTKVPVEGSEMEIISVGEFVYLKGLPGQAKPWVKIDPKASDPVSQMFKGIAEGGISDPTKMAENLKGTKATLKSKDGGNSTYEFTVDSAKALGTTATPAPSPSASAQALTMTYVLDKDDRPVTISTKVADQSIKVTYSDWGKKVDITEPPADQVGPMSFPSS